MQNGESYQFKATLDGHNLTGLETIDWSIQGNTSSNTKISSTGLLEVGSDEIVALLLLKPHMEIQYLILKKSLLLLLIH